MGDTAEGADGLEAALSGEDTATRLNEAADPQALVEAHVPADIRDRHEVHSYRGAAVLLSEAHRARFAELCGALRAFSIAPGMIRTAGGEESDTPKLLSETLRPLGWNETLIRGDLIVRPTARERVGDDGKKAKYQATERELRRERFLDGHKIDYVKERVAFDLEWNSKDQTFDRDLYAFSAFAQCGVIDVGVLLTRGSSLNPVVPQLGQSLKRTGQPEFKDGKPRRVSETCGASAARRGEPPRRPLRRAGPAGSGPAPRRRGSPDRGAPGAAA